MKKIALLLSALVVAGTVVMIVVAQSGSQPASNPASQPKAAAASKPVVEQMPYKVDFEKTTMALKGTKFDIELALTDEQVKRGLMYRDSLPADAGMLFVMPREDTWSFWMHQTRIPLDIIYLDKTGKILEIHARAPFDETGKGPAENALFIIELNLGRAEKLGLKRGDKVEILSKYLPR
jgi:uncharacterized membrane protein (UPF0127 family)